MHEGFVIVVANQGKHILREARWTDDNNIVKATQTDCVMNAIKQNLSN